MTQLASPPPSARYTPPLRERAVRRAPEAVVALLGGVVAAGLGLGAIAVLVLLMWITSPYPDGGPGDALHVAAALWLLAHGARLLRPDALTGGWAPVGVTPALLLALPVWLVHRAAAHALSEDEPDDDAATGDVHGAHDAGDADGADEGSGPGLVRGPHRSWSGRPRLLGPVGTTAWLVGGYLLVAVLVVCCAQVGPLRAEPLWALLRVPVVAACAGASGAWTACGCPPLALPRRLRGWSYEIAVAVRAGLAGAVALAGGGALLVAIALGWHAHAVGDAFTGLTNALSGRCAVLLLAAALVPNAAVWSAAYALGPGFAVGLNSAVSPAGAHGYPPVLPRFPLLAALPHGSSAVAWAALAVPVCAGGVVAWFVGRAAVGDGWTVGRIAGACCGAAVVCGGVLTVATWFTAGPMGVDTLARFGPDGWLTGGAAAAWTAAIALPGALGAWWWHRREPKAPVESAEDRAASAEGAGGQAETPRP
ncbi:DUF6350 family protein [Streptomyces sp. PTM05]|uniref:DUF6350 family protein n=1 Tax=Streptantibioticus parmotrematis TaxID=2873249 RepID=A0ABS7QL30_9ACTN|nr:DUF6350 family protein [Streptantibioticus parmotrematis]MBY8883902.1 DUF6350 family protein [Streptantibioticus parmotrematis]